MIRHTVVFRFFEKMTIPEQKDFFNEVMKLGSIPGVKKFERLKQTGFKNSYKFGLSMEFDSQDSYDNYTSHPIHSSFVQKYWLTFVEDFLEIDYEPLNM